MIALRYEHLDYKRAEAFKIILDELERLTALEDRIDELIVEKQEV